MFGGNRRISVRCHRRSRLPLMKPRWVIVCVLLVCLVLLFTCYFIYDPVAAYLFVSKFVPNPVIGRDFRGDEISSRAVIREFLNASQHHSKTPKTAFLFFIQDPLPFEMLGDKFFNGNEGKFSIYIHNSTGIPNRKSRHFVNWEIRSGQVGLGDIRMVDAERRLLAT
ncbi:uncharacterized protein LOC123200895 [Mangifera indica]|uniref:uncharacterized protein LOC123200895 n=1 Tax=Mangifera indica TaxID=29780 RepID=UPI001CFB4180|nr:uncharacterized protein LOC123200895 [Mangifera indica]